MRARNIKPGFFTNEDLAEIPHSARLLYIGLWCIADCNGNLENRPKKIKAEIFPYESVKIDSLIQALGQYGFILGYAVNGVEYFHIPKFKDHQHPHHREKPKHPEPTADAGFHDSLKQALGRPSTSPSDSGYRNPDIIKEKEPKGSKKKVPLIEFDSEICELVNITEAHRKKWKKAFPGVDIDAEISKAEIWLTDNPNRRKARYASFLSRWFGNATKVEVDDDKPRKREMF